MAVALLNVGAGIHASIEPGQPSAKLIRRAQHPIHDQYIVMLAPDHDGSVVGADAERRFSGRLKHVYNRALTGFAIRMPAAAAAKLAEDPRVLLIEEDGVFQLAQAAPTWGLDRIDQRSLPLDGVFNVNATGLGVAVHVLDTGIRTGHVEFGTRARLGGDYIDDDGDGDPNDIGNDDGDPSTPDGADCHGHGTHVAGTIGGFTYGVAKNVTLYGHRVLGCGGSGAISGIIAAIDAVTAHPARPAVVNMSLGGGVSAALDEAVRSSIAAGVTHVVAAGNDDIDAQYSSPARVATAITVGATDTNDVRASFSNFGAVIDLFAPGVGVDSAWFTGDTAVRRLSGTSMATPHVAGAAALHLEQNPTDSPEQVRTALVAAATANVIGATGSGSPNRLLFVGTEAAAALAIVAPNGGERVFAGTQYLVTWTATAGAFNRFDGEFSADGGTTFAPMDGCRAIGGTERSCLWTPPATATSKAQLRITGQTSATLSPQDRSDALFEVATTVPSLTVTAPNTAVTWAVGSANVIKWSHNLGANAWVRVELSRDGGATFPEVLASAVKNTSATRGSYSWPVVGPDAAAAIVRVSWIQGPVADVSNTPFRISDPFLAVSSPTSSSTNWGIGTVQRVKWTTNLGRDSNVQVQLSTDGGATFPFTLATVRATAGVAEVTIPAGVNTSAAARVRVIWPDAPAGTSVGAVSPSFTVAAPFVLLTTPNGGESWTAGSSETLKWKSNLGTLESVRLELSHDGGATWGTVLAPGTRSDGAEKFVVNGAWIGTTVKARVVWIKSGVVSDASNAVFTVR